MLVPSESKSLVENQSYSIPLQEYHGLKKEKAWDYSETETIPNGTITLERGLKSRHVQFIAYGGCVGTGLFISTGSALLTCGPAPVLISYIIMSIVIFFVMNMLGEMTSYLPLPGNTPQKLIANYVDKSLGFACGYNYWYAFAMLVPTEITSAGIVIQYWNQSVNIAVWITISFLFIIGINFSPVKYFGEAEFFFSSVKLTAVIGLIILGVVIFFGGAPAEHGVLGFHYWKEPGAFVEHLATGNTARFLDVWTAIVKSGLAFICSPELIACSGGECVEPRRNLPKACNRFIYRLAFFYIGGTLVIGIMVPYTSDKLMGLSNASASPFVIGIQNAGIKVLNHIINAVILISSLSSGNSFLYSSSRTLFSMANDGMSWKCFKKVNRYGIPYYAVGVSSLLGVLAYCNVSSSGSSVFNWFSNISTISGFLGWIFVSVAYLRWRKAIRFHRLEDRVTYRTILQPYGAYFVIFFIGILLLTNGYAVFFDFNASDFVAAYITLPIFAVLYIGHQIYEYVKFKRLKFATPLEDIDVITGLDIIEDEEQTYEERKPRNVLERIWFWIA